MNKLSYLLCLLFFAGCADFNPVDQSMRLNDKQYYEKRGLNILVFSNWYNGLFDDSKMSGIEIIHHGVRTVTNGDVRLDRTPEQWDAIPTFAERKIDSTSQTIEAFLEYPKYNFKYSIKASPIADGIEVTVNLPNALPKELEGRAGFNLEFLPAAYFEKGYLMDNTPGTLPLYPSGPMKLDGKKAIPMPLASGSQLVMAPEDAERRITIKTENELSLYDGRNKAQNGWYVVQSLIPGSKTGEVVKWQITGSTLPNWSREPVIAHSQLGYHPDQKKVALVELDPNDTKSSFAILYKVLSDGTEEKIWTANTEYVGQFTRYDYTSFDFTEVKEEGLYFIEYAQVKTQPFMISKDVYAKAWQPTLDIYMPVQMDHVMVNEAYRIWHGRSHMDDALQAPVSLDHFDLYGQGPTTDTPYKPGEHIPGLNIGGWYDAGDYDIRTQTQYRTVLDLVKAYEAFGIDRDETLVDQEAGYVDLHHPDGKNDLLQQIEHGTLALIAQHRAVGHAIPGIIVPHISQYTHLGDGLTMTDNLIYNSKMDSLESNGFESGIYDDRWAFTSRSSALNYGSAGTLAAASRALKDFNPELAKECLQTAINVWEEESNKEPDTFRVGNTTGGRLNSEKLNAATQLLITTKDPKYKKAVSDLWTELEGSFGFHVAPFLSVFDQMDASYQEAVKEAAMDYKQWADSLEFDNPFLVPIGRGGWAGNGWVIRFGTNNYELAKRFPDLFDKEYTLRALNYIYGTHPDSDISFVSGVGTKSKKVGYGMNRADYSFIAGGIVPGVLILPPDFPENKEDWPFLWGENEYVVNLGAAYIYLVHSANDLLN